MIRIILFLMVTMVSFCVSAQNNYEFKMKEAIALFDNGDIKESSILFEEIALGESQSWLPNYYVALSNALLSFEAQDKDEKSKLIEKSEVFLNKELSKESENAEILVVKSLIYTAWIVYDPFLYGQQNFNLILNTNAKAKRIAPKNPRVVYQTALIEMNGAKYMGGNPSDYCDDMKQAIELFATFKPESELHPNWGLQNAKKAIEQECNN